MNNAEVIGKRIKLLRETTGLNQQQLADALEIPRPAVSQIENGERKISAEELIDLSDVFQQPIDVILGIREPIDVILPEDKLMVTKKPIRIDVPQQNLAKFKEVLLFLLNKIGSKPNVGETVLYKLLYFIDFDYYEKYEEQLIGATYQKNMYGPTPVEFPKIVKRMIKDGDIEKLTSKYFAYPQTKYMPVRKPNLSLLNAQEIETIEDVIARLSDMNASKISEYSHKDVPWMTTDDGGIIKYESVFYRSEPYSMREYEPIVA